MRFRAVAHDARAMSLPQEIDLGRRRLEIGLPGVETARHVLAPGARTAVIDRCHPPLNGLPHAHEQGPHDDTGQQDHPGDPLIAADQRHQGEHAHQGQQPGSRLRHQDADQQNPTEGIEQQLGPVGLLELDGRHHHRQGADQHTGRIVGVEEGAGRTAGNGLDLQEQRIGPGLHALGEEAMQGDDHRARDGRKGE